MSTSFPPQIDRVRVFNDVSFDLMSITDTQVYNGSSVTMKFLDRNGNPLSGGYVNSDCVFLQVIDEDQDEDLYRRERIDGFWDGGQNVPFGPVAIKDFICDGTYDEPRCVNQLLGTINIFNDNPADSAPHDATTVTSCDGVAGILTDHAGWAKIYILNPRSGRWAAVDLLETGVASHTFVSVTCIDLVSVYSGCVPTLDVLPGDTIVAFYQDPTNHSDSAMISAKVSVGGSGPTTGGSQVFFVNSSGSTVTSYLDTDMVYVKVVDTSHSGGTVGVTKLVGAVEIDGVAYDVTATDTTGTFMSAAIDLDLVGGDTITVTYTDPSDSADTDTATATVTASALEITDFVAGPNPFADEVAFFYEGSGIAETFTVTIYDLAGHVVWTETLPNVTEVVWDGTDEDGADVANGAYIYVLMATDGTETFDSENTESAKGMVFINPNPLPDKGGTSDDEKSDDRESSSPHGPVRGRVGRRNRSVQRVQERSGRASSGHGWSVCGGRGRRDGGGVEPGGVGVPGRHPTDGDVNGPVWSGDHAPVRRRDDVVR
jgi:flagellar hook assembly protein FlgD